MPDSFKPKTYTRDKNGRTVERVAYTPTEAVQLEGDGWVEKTQERAGTRANPPADKS